MVKNADLSYSAYSGSDIYLDSSFNLVFSTSYLVSLTLYIEASNPTALSFGYLPVLLTVSNFAPYFTEGPPAAVQITVGEALTYTIPSYIDNEDPAVSLAIEGLDETFMTFDDALMTIELLPEVLGNYTIVLKITDTLGLTTSAEVLIEVLELVLEEETAAI